ncbi:Tripartite-type tricarboxylate transporter, receptor component TctC [Noviherbaspirillum humi]|uniref:Tripartite-type tricarboxylate transporter, receptor component TctC n=1 Tax=Noviherbaspirillum humi TaxID=1688639 RepID=A0A239BV45_9BURK|nr:tripartite tricarboxylate transporter substrate binding protein [Noviherbaspirillum humi]SNS11897.1 Tripartite-type tricarboxylate transporter, receptor component TctC [Noviherbaspirillum humi]
MRQNLAPSLPRRRACIRLLGLGLTAATMSLAMSHAAHAADPYPSRPIKVILPFPPGGSSDSVLRLVGQKLSELLKQPVIVDNRPGANGVLGAEIAAKSAPDGYTALFTDRGALAINPSLYKKLTYDPIKDFKFAGVVVWAPYVLVANPKVPASTMTELVNYAKKNPGKLNYASFGIGSMTQMGMESLNERFGTAITHIPYKGGGPAATATMSGEVDLSLATVGTASGPIKAGKLKPLVYGNSDRSPQLPQVATIVEAGGKADTIPPTFFGFAFPARTPDDIVKKFSAEVKRVLAMPEVADKLVENGYVIGKMSPEDMSDTLKHDVVEFGRLAKKLGIEPE